MKTVLEKKLTYKEAVAYLDQFQFHGFRLGLERMEAILDALDGPHHHYPSVHVAGTNGKGSTCAFLSSILVEAGYKTGLYTSPHLFSLTERFKINHENIAENELAKLIYEIKTLIEKGYELSYFEYTTAIAMLWFAREKVDIALFETGLGGRLDATNVIDPEISIITNISLDHQSYLGATVKEIAWEKAGIIKPEKPVVSGVKAPPASEVVKKRCEELDAQLFLLGRDFFAQSVDILHMDYTGLGTEMKKVPLGLLGSHQAQNGALAAAASELLAKRGWTIGGYAMKRGLATPYWPGRGELLEGKHVVLLDGAHNLDGVKRLKELLAGLEGLGIPNREASRLLLWACSNEGRDKDFFGMLKELAPLFGEIVITEPPGPRNPVEIDDWKTYLPKIINNTRLEKDWQTALLRTMELCKPDDLLCIAGSLYLVGSVREKLIEQGFRIWHSRS